MRRRVAIEQGPPYITYRTRYEPCKENPWQRNVPRNVLSPSMTNSRILQRPSATNMATLGQARTTVAPKYIRRCSAKAAQQAAGERRGEVKNKNDCASERCTATTPRNPTPPSPSPSPLLPAPRLPHRIAPHLAAPHRTSPHPLNTTTQLPSPSREQRRHQHNVAAVIVAAVINTGS